MCTNYYSDFKAILFNILGGVLVILLERLISFVLRKFKLYRFKSIFGQDVIDNFNLIYTKFQMTQVYTFDGRPEPMPFVKTTLYQKFSINNPISYSETKSSNLNYS